MLKTTDLNIVDAETDTCINLVQWFRLEASVSSHEWKATWERKRAVNGNVMLLRSTDLTEAWFVLDTYEGEVSEIDCDINQIRVKNYKVISTRAEAAKADYFSSVSTADDFEPMAMRWGED